MKTKVYNQTGKESKEIDLPENIFGVDFNGDLVSQVLFIQRSNRRAGTAQTKDRSQVAGSNKKPWRQKGTGQARHGQKSSPIWRHGGVTHGPTNERNYKKELPKAMKNAALFNLLSAKLRDGQVLLVDELKTKDAKTKEAVTMMKALATIKGYENLDFKKQGNVYLTFPKLEVSEKRAFKNLPYVNVHNLDDINPLDIANARYIVLVNPEATVDYLEKKNN